MQVKAGVKFSESYEEVLAMEVKASGDVEMSATCNSAPQPLASTALLSDECKSASQICERSDVRQE